MKTRLIILLAVCATLLSPDVKAQGVEFFRGGFEAGAAKAKEENKVLFIDFYADWCGPCKRMVADVFPDETLGAFFREHVVALQIDTEAEENGALVRKYSIKSLPTLIFTDPEGNVLASTVGALHVEGLMRQARIAIGEAPDFTKLYDQYRSSKNDLGLAKQLLQDAPDFMAGLTTRMDADKWRVRIERIFKDYIKAKMGPDLINPDDYRIIRAFNPEPQANDEIAEFIVKNLGEFLEEVGTAPAYYVIEYNSRVMQTYAQAGNTEYKKWLDRISGDMAPAYDLLPKGTMSKQERETYRYDGEYLLFAKKDAVGYINHMNSYFGALGDEVEGATFAEAAQKLYQAMGNRLTPSMHEQAKEWMLAALEFPDNPTLNRLNYFVMLGDTYRQLGEFENAKKCYNQAYVESFELGRPVTQQALQSHIQRKLSQLEAARAEQK